MFGYELYSTAINTFELNQIYCKYDSHSVHYLLYDKEAETLWNSMFKVIIDKMKYNPLLADSDFDFKKHEKEIEKKLKEFLKHRDELV